MIGLKIPGMEDGVGPAREDWDILETYTGINVTIYGHKYTGMTIYGSRDSSGKGRCFS